MRKNLFWIALIFCFIFLAADINPGYGADEFVNRDTTVFNYIVEIKDNSFTNYTLDRGIILSYKKSRYMIFFAQSINDSDKSEDLISNNAVLYDSPVESHLTAQEGYPSLFPKITIEKSRFKIKIEKVKPFTVNQFEKSGATLQKK